MRSRAIFPLAINRLRRKSVVMRRSSRGVVFRGLPDLGVKNLLNFFLSVYYLEVEEGGRCGQGVQTCGCVALWPIGSSPVTYVLCAHRTGEVLAVWRLVYGRT